MWCCNAVWLFMFVRNHLLIVGARCMKYFRNRLIKALFCDIQGIMDFITPKGRLFLLLSSNHVLVHYICLSCMNLTLIVRYIFWTSLKHKCSYTKFCFRWVVKSDQIVQDGHWKWHELSHGLFEKSVYQSPRRNVFCGSKWRHHRFRPCCLSSWNGYWNCS